MTTDNKFAEVAINLPLEKTFHYRIPDGMAARAVPGMRVEVPFGPKRLTGYIVSTVAASAVDNPKEILSLIDDEPAAGGELLELARWISSEYLCSLGEALATVTPAAVKAPKRPRTAPEHAAFPAQPARPGFELTQAQRTAVEAINAATASGKDGAFLLYGVTGSGKTEVYLSAIEETLKRGRSAVFLLPEIALTPQFISIVRGRFPGAVGVWHSRISAGEKYAVWDKARKGALKIMLGARSAVFAPLKSLGLIIVDEEHEPTYKQEQKPAYHTREVALKRARLNGAVAVFGSATPSLEMYYRARSGEVRLLELPSRIDDRALPRVNIIDAKRLHRKSGILSEAAVSALKKVLARREQAIVFLNRRGFSPGIMCRHCGKVWQCPNCSVSLVYHRSPESLKCHYCDHAQPWPGVCPACGSRDVSVFGAGTQKVEEELKKIFPQGRIFRLDRDTTRKAGVYEAAYRDFKEENFDILLGTQMVAKGFDFPRVTLVVVVDADTALYLPDFRASERTFQVLAQVAGRSGRSELGGEVMIQTCHPEHYVLKASKDHDFKEFYGQEIEFRRELRYPPFISVANIVFRAKKEEKAKSAAENAAAMLTAYRQERGEDLSVLGPSPAARNKLHGYFRWQLILKGGRQNLMDAAKMLKKAELSSGVILSADIDPQNML